MEKRKSRNTDCYALLDVRRSREIVRVTSNVDRVCSLVYPDVIDFHLCGQWQMGEVNVSKVLGHPQVYDHVLYMNQ